MRFSASSNSSHGWDSKFGRAAASCLATLVLYCAYSAFATDNVQNLSHFQD
jgi:hypothetical protein